MTVKFEFTVSDVDAENIIGIMREAALKAQLAVDRYTDPHLSATDQANRAWWIAHHKYLSALADRMAAGTTRVQLGADHD